MARTTGREITDRLIDVHRAYGWRAEKEAWFSPRRIDVLAISHAGRDVICFEIKVSREDFKNELRDPDKRKTVMRNCTQFYFVVPENLLSHSDIPEGCGLVYYRKGWMWVEVPAPAKHSELTFETELRNAREREEEEHQEQILREAKEEEEINSIEDADAFECAPSLQFPGWMLPWFRKPLRFQFDVAAVAAKMARAALPVIEFDFDEVPF